LSSRRKHVHARLDDKDCVGAGGGFTVVGADALEFSAADADTLASRAEHASEWRRRRNNMRVLQDVAAVTPISA